MRWMYKNTTLVVQAQYREGHGRGRLNPIEGIGETARSISMDNDKGKASPGREKRVSESMT